MIKFLTALFFGLLVTCFTQIGYAQDQKNIKPAQDTVKKLNEVVIRPYFSLQPLLRSTGSIGLIDSSLLDKQPSSSFVSSLNTVAGVRMEERSPGSYRLSLRGSLLRSPFGIRNVKIYFDDFPLTDAGGNSYLNALDVAGTGSLQVLKGPHSSIFGANSGGVILVQTNPVSGDQPVFNFKTEGGSYGLFREDLSLKKQWKNYSLGIVQAYQHSDGYRDHSSMDRKYLQILQKFDYADKASLKALIFYSDLHYNTPGGLTDEQYSENPASSRPSAGPNRSAAEQKAGIFSKTLYGGISNEWVINNHFKHVISVFGSYTDFKNPFITNYEKRKEYTGGVRTYLEYEKIKNTARWKLNIGLESMQTSTDVDNFDNEYGLPAGLQTADELRAGSNFAFAHLNIDLWEKFLAEISASANVYGYSYKSIAPVAAARKTNNFDLQLMPRIALSYLLTDNFSVRGSVSKGYSPPTLAEVRASDQNINTDLQPESGWSYESGIRYQGDSRRIFVDVNGFYYHLNNAIVRRVNQQDAEFFVNAGGTKQWGLETSLSAWIIPSKNSGFIRGLQFRNAYTLSFFKFDNYLDADLDYSGNELTGVPKTVVVSTVDLHVPGSVYLFLQHNYTSEIPLNDANTAYARKYHLLQSKLGWKNLKIGRVPVELFVGADNLLNEHYSLGNDLNAFAGRYFNAAPLRNFYGGLALRL